MKEFFENISQLKDVDFTRVRIVTGLPFWVPAGRAITLGHSIYFDATGRARYRPTHTPQGVALIGHELFHVHQHGGNILWYFEYIMLWVLNGLDAGETHPLERPAYKFETDLSDAMRTAEGNPADKLIKNDCLDQNIAKKIYAIMQTK